MLELEVARLKLKLPIFVTQPLYSMFTGDDLMYNEIRAQCHRDNPSSTILCFDKTFNLTKNYKVTLTCFRHKNLKKIGIDRNVLMIGPTFIHQDSDFMTFNAFISHIKAKLSAVPLSGIEIHDDAVLGSDDELALVKALESNFRDSALVFCTRHIQVRKVTGAMSHLWLLGLAKNVSRVLQRSTRLEMRWLRQLRHEIAVGVQN